MRAPRGQVDSHHGHPMQGTGLLPRDHSSDRNEQHHPALEHHPTNVACPRGPARSETCMHLLIAGPPVSVQVVPPMIIVSGSSAKVTRRGRAGRRTPTRSRSSAARNVTPQYVDARPISVHTEVLVGVKEVVASGSRRWPHGLESKWCGSRSCNSSADRAGRPGGSTSRHELLTG